MSINTAMTFLIVEILKSIHVVTKLKGSHIFSCISCVPNISSLFLSGIQTVQDNCDRKTFRC